MKYLKMTIWVMVCVLCVSSSQVMGWIQYNDGGTYDITTTINDDVWVDYLAPGMGTTVNLLPGGAIGSSYELQAYEDSIINVSGGSINDILRAYDRTKVDISDGSTWILFAHDSSQVDISGGSITMFRAHNTSQVTISNGSISFFLFAHDSSQVDISGGSIGADLYSTQGIITVFGSDFMVDGQPVNYGSISSIFGGGYGEEPSRRLTGTLLNGGTIDSEFYIAGGGQIFLVPEPTTLLLLGLGGLVLRRRKA